MVVSSTIVNDNTNYAMELYSLAYKIHSNSHTANTTANINKNKNIKIHLIRVPKASSTSLSAVARRIVGCTPPGISLLIILILILLL